MFVLPIFTFIASVLWKKLLYLLNIFFSVFINIKTCNQTFTFSSSRVGDRGPEGARKEATVLTPPPSAPPPTPTTPWTRAQRRGAPPPTCPRPPPTTVRRGTSGHSRTRRPQTTTGRVCRPPSATSLPRRSFGKLVFGSAFTCGGEVNVIPVSQLFFSWKLTAPPKLTLHLST